MAERLGLGVMPGTGWSAREAEGAGFDAIFATEVNNDALVTTQLLGSATRRIQVGTWVANIYLRHLYVCAQGAALIADAIEGRFVLGLGVSHEPVNRALRTTCHTLRRRRAAMLPPYAAGYRVRARPRTSPSGPRCVPCRSMWRP
jgi:alkanesulfonate monooxygenase SsuD/methylene tetrahydromethanopterin reductase-like flavin-dependent oxidoreductase (luciferase family)